MKRNKNENESKTSPERACLAFLVMSINTAVTAKMAKRSAAQFAISPYCSDRKNAHSPNIKVQAANARYL